MGIDLKSQILKCMDMDVYLPTLTYKVTQMELNIPNMERLGMFSTLRKSGAGLRLRGTPWSMHRTGLAKSGLRRDQTPCRSHDVGEAFSAKSQNCIKCMIYGGAQNPKSNLNYDPILCKRYWYDISWDRGNATCWVQKIDSAWSIRLQPLFPVAP